MHRDRRQHGFTLVELMVSIAIGLMLLAGLTSLFFSNSNAQSEVERANRQVENGRYAMQLMTGDLRNAGFFAEFDPAQLALPAAAPDPCSTNLADLRSGIALPVQGYDNSTTITCLPDLKANTDIVVVRHTDTCVVGAADCDAASAGGPFFQASTCNNDAELGSSDPLNQFQVAAIDSGFTLHKKDCNSTPGSGTPADLRRLLTHIYFIANNSMAGDGIPTLKRAEVVSNGGVLSVQVVPLSEGIENMQIEYGIDSNADGVADIYTSDTDSAANCHKADCAVTNWSNVVSLKLYLLARTLTPSVGQIDAKSYTLGLDSKGKPNVYGPTNDKFKRHVFTSLIGLPNVAGRKS
ncbi:PilW family protein [Pseudoduganella violaceinigra]|uniref:PilW family protein n=1 Tax=Pseudoduganella violaceinigra TaxID=246602 RepID=UPI0003F6E23E|nr:PilW family protein [Pseudoduganella violaceinigra]